MSEKRYEIRTVADFAAIPVEKLDACLLDFDGWLRFRAAVKLLQGVEMHDPDVFPWIDDGKHFAKVTVHGPGGELLARQDIETARPESE